MADDLSIDIELDLAGDATAGLATAAAEAQQLKDTLASIQPPSVVPPGGWPAPPMPAPAALPAPMPAPPMPAVASGDMGTSGSSYYGSSSDSSYADDGGGGGGGGFNPMQMMRSGFMAMRAPRMALRLAQTGITMMTSMTNEANSPDQLSTSFQGLSDEMNAQIPIIGGLIKAITDFGKAMDGTTTSIQVGALVAKDSIAQNQATFQASQSLAAEDVKMAGLTAREDVMGAGAGFADQVGVSPLLNFGQAVQRQQQHQQLLIQQQTADAAAASSDAQLTQLEANMIGLQAGQFINPNQFSKDMQAKLGQVQQQQQARVMASGEGGMFGQANAAGYSNIAAWQDAGSPPPGSGGPAGAGVSKALQRLQQQAGPTPEEQRRAELFAAFGAELPQQPQFISIADAMAQQQAVIDRNQGVGGSQAAYVNAAQNLEVLQAQQGMNVDAQLANLQQQQGMIPQWGQAQLAQMTAQDVAPLKQQLGEAQQLLGQVTTTTNAAGAAVGTGQADLALQAIQQLQASGPETLSQEQQALIRQFGGGNMLQLAQQDAVQGDPTLAAIQAALGQVNAQGQVQDLQSAQTAVLDLTDKVNVMIELDNNIIADQVSQKLIENQKEITRLTEQKMQLALDKIENDRRLQNKANH